MRTRHKALLACAALSAALCVAGDARAQGKEKSRGDKHAAPARQESAKSTERRVVRHQPAKSATVTRTVTRTTTKTKVVQAKPGKPAKRVVTTDRAIVVTREVLVKHGYEVVRVETIRGTRVVYYRRGNMGRGRGKGPIVKMVIRPAEERVVFESAPRGLVAELNVRLGL